MPNSQSPRGRSSQAQKSRAKKAQAQNSRAKEQISIQKNTAKGGRRPLEKEDHKYKRGVVAVAAGSERFPGAATLAVGGARRGGAGYVKFVSKSAPLIQQVINQFPDVVPIRELLNQKIDSLVVGPGGVSLRKLPAIPLVVLDGAAMKLAVQVIPSKRTNQIIVLTPHEGELNLIGYVMPKNYKERALVAQKVADELNVVIVLKGSKTIIAAPNLKSIVDEIGGAELATAGSGDVLAGLIGAFLASWKPEDLSTAQKVVAAAVKLHSKAGVHAAKKYSCVVATDLLESLAHC